MTGPNAPLLVQTPDKVDRQKIKVGIEGLNLGVRTEREFAAADRQAATICAVRRTR